MKVSETVMTVVITLLGILPFIWFTYIGKKASNKNKKAIKDLLKTENMKFNDSEFWNYNFIGIDEAANQLMFIKLNELNNDILKIDLTDVKSCQIDKNTRDYKREKKIESELQTLDLELSFISKQPTISLNFYNIEDHLSESFEMNRAEKWQQTILKNSHKTVVKSTAA